MKGGIPSSIDAVSFPLCPKDTLHAKKWDDAIASSSPIASPVSRTKDEMATIIYTSGSTGKWVEPIQLNDIEQLAIVFENG